MRTIVSIFGQQYAERPLGVAGENEATVLEIDARGVLQQYPAAYFSIKLKRADGALYIAAAGLAADADAMVRYTVAAADVSVPGLLEMEIQATVQNVVIKTSRYYFSIVGAIDTGWPLPPDPTWVDDVIDAAGRSQAGAVRSETAADRAEAALAGLGDDAERAEEAAKRAEESRNTVVAIAGNFTDAEAERKANELVRQDSEAERIALYDVIREEYESGGFDGSLLYATFGMDFDAGELVMYTPDGYDGPEFTLSAETCNLEVRVGGGEPIGLGRVVPMPAGDWSAAASYPFLAVVYYQGDAYLSKQPSQGKLPTDAAYWMRVTRVGEGVKIRVGQVTTGAPGTAAVVVNVGTEFDQVWNITIPRGQDGGGGIGDMTKAVYDKNGDGVVDNAAALGGKAAGDYALKAELPQDVLRYDTAQTLTAAQQAAVRTKIGAGNSGFDGNYNSLTNKPTIPTAAADIGAVPVTRKVAGKALGADITLAAGDVGAVPTTRQVNGKALSADITLASSDVGAVPTSRTINGKALGANIALVADDVGAVPATRKVAGKALDTDITLAASDVGAVPTSRTVAGKALSANITLAAADVGLGNVNNTSDANKPVSTATQAALDGKSNASHTHSQYLTTETDPNVPAWAKAATKPAYTAAETGALPLSGGTLTGNLVTNNPAIGTSAARNIYAGTADLTPGTSALPTGSIYLVYE